MTSRRRVIAVGVSAGAAALAVAVWLIVALTGSPTLAPPPGERQGPHVISVRHPPRPRSGPEVLFRASKVTRCGSGARDGSTPTHPVTG